MVTPHSYIPNADEKLRVLRQLCNIRLEDQGGTPPCYMIYVQDRDTPNIRYWARQSFDRDELIIDMYDHYHRMLLAHCHVS